MSIEREKRIGVQTDYLQAVEENSSGSDQSRIPGTAALPGTVCGSQQGGIRREHPHGAMKDNHHSFSAKQA